MKTFLKITLAVVAGTAAAVAGFVAGWYGRGQVDMIGDFDMFDE